MGFQWAGAAAGAGQAVDKQAAIRQALAQQQLENQRAAEEMGLRRQALMAQLANNASQEQRAGRDQQLQEAGIALQQVDTGDQTAELTPDTLNALKGTPYAARVDEKQTLPSSNIPLAGALPQSDAGGQSFATLRPTGAQMAQTQQATSRRQMVDLVKRGAPRSDVIGAMAEAGENITPAILEDPAKVREEQRRQAFSLEDLRNRHEMQQIGARAAADRNGQPQLMQVTETDPATGEVITRLVPKQVGEVARRPGAPPTQGQFSAGGYAGRIEQAEGVLGKVGGDIAGMGYANHYLQSHMPAAGQSGAFQSYEQAARNFINAVLRRESGAAISPSEFDNAKSQYLPQPGDKPDTLTQKKANRDYVFQTLKREAGRAYQPPIEPPSAGGGRVYYDANGNQEQR